MESNISGFLGMSANRDDDDTQYSYNNSSYSNRVSNRRKHYIESGYKTKKGINLDIDTGEILDFLPKPMRSSSRNFRRYSSKIPLPKPSTLINVVIVGGIGLMAYKLYNKFFSSDGSDLIANATDSGNKALASTYVSTSGAKAAAITSTANSLATSGLVVSDLHRSLANTFHDMLDSLWVDHDKIVKTILGQNVQTFRLVSVAYGTRSLPTYGNSPAHLLNPDVWSLTNLFSGNKFTGTLKDHLQEILTSSELTQIHAYISVI